MRLPPPSPGSPPSSSCSSSSFSSAGSRRRWMAVAGLAALLGCGFFLSRGPYTHLLVGAGALGFFFVLCWLYVFPVHCQPVEKEIVRGVKLQQKGRVWRRDPHAAHVFRSGANKEPFIALLLCKEGPCDLLSPHLRKGGLQGRLKLQFQFTALNRLSI
uniref:Uncharacterized protein n=1 Tax=Anolis carolinensis TaxID=28377 RepID=A0A803TT55_ANOCA